MENSVKKAYSKDDAERLLSSISAQIQHADNKASILLAFLGIIVGLTLNAFEILNRLDFINRTTISVISVIFFILYLSSLSVSLSFEIVVLTARYSIKRFERYGIKNHLFYFGYIGKVGYDCFKTDLESLSEEDVLQEINAQIVINSLIAKKKYKFFNLALFASIIVFISALIIAILASLL